MAKEYFLTKEGYDNLVAKLDHLINVERRDASERIKRAREFGDLSENAEYDAAKEHQAYIESEILMIQAQIDNAVIIEDTEGKVNSVILGCTVKMIELDDGEEMEYTIVGTTEASIFDNKISNESPLAQAILGKKVGQTVTVNMGDNSYQVKILSINK